MNTEEENYCSMTDDELLKLLDEWRGAGNYKITGEIVRELRTRRLNAKRKNKSSAGAERKFN